MRGPLSLLLLVPRPVYSGGMSTKFFLLVESIYCIFGVIAEICDTIKDLKDAGMVIHTILPIKFSFG